MNMVAVKTKTWVQVLAEECAKTSQAKVRNRLRQPDGYPSTSIISQVLSDKYPCPTDRIQAIVEGAYMNRKVKCSVLGEITTDQCESHQARKFANTNAVRVKLYQACHNYCPHSHVKE